MEKLFDICFSDKKEEMKKEKMMNQQIKELIYIAKKEKENIFS
jgi:hypothetical protein